MVGAAARWVTCTGIVMGVFVKHLPLQGCHLAAWNCFVPAALFWWSLPLCPSEPWWRGMKFLWKANVLERG